MGAAVGMLVGEGVGAGVGGGVGGALPQQSLSVIGLPMSFVHASFAPAGHGHAKLFVAESLRRR